MLVSQMNTYTHIQLLACVGSIFMATGKSPLSLFITSAHNIYANVISGVYSMIAHKNTRCMHAKTVLKTIA